METFKNINKRFRKFNDEKQKKEIQYSLPKIKKLLDTLYIGLIVSIVLSLGLYVVLFFYQMRG